MAEIDPGSARVFAALLEARTGQRIAVGRSWRFEASLGPLLQAHALDRVDQLAARLIEGKIASAYWTRSTPRPRIGVEGSEMRRSSG